MTALAGFALVAAVLLNWARPGRASLSPVRRPLFNVVRGRWLISGLAALTVFWLLLLLGVLPWGISLGAISLALAEGVHQVRGRATISSNRAAVVEACQSLSAQLRAGRIPSVALERAAAGSDVLFSTLAAQRVGADVPAALRDQARVPGCEGLDRLAAAWQLCARTGASLVPVTWQVSESLRAAQANALAVEAELAAPRATGRLLALLPILGVAMGFLAGGDPLTFLLGSVAGQWCLCAAVVLMCCGLVWVERLAAIR